MRVSKSFWFGMSFVGYVMALAAQTDMQMLLAGLVCGAACGELHRRAEG